MLQTDRFLLHQTLKNPILQPDCPVYVHCTRQCEDRRSGAKLVQLRMVNCGASAVETVVFDVEGWNACGEQCFTLPALVMAGCKAECGKIFGDDRIFSLKGHRASQLRVVVRQVIFADGMSWKCLPSHSCTTAEAAGWKPCSCGMPNPRERSKCIVCGEALKEAEPEIVTAGKAEEALPIAEPAIEPMPKPLSAPAPEPKPAPVVRSKPPAPTPVYADVEYDDEDDEGSVPIWLSVMLCVFGTLAILALLAFGAFFLHQYIL